MENLYVVCKKDEFNKYKDWASGGENYSLDGSLVQFSGRFKGEQVAVMITDGLTVYNKDEIVILLASADWREQPDTEVKVDKKFKEDYAAANDKLSFLKEKLKLK